MSQPTVNVDDLEVVDGFAHENLEGWIPSIASEEELKEALEKAFDYRGDITLTFKSGDKVEAYIFNRQTGKTLADSTIQYFASNAPDKKRAAYADIARIEFTGKDRAAGKQWEAWVKKYAEKKAAGETNIALMPEALD
jgi:Zn/Cd-binding protein ZinT